MQAKPRTAQPIPVVPPDTNSVKAPRAQIATDAIALA